MANAKRNEPQIRVVERTVTVIKKTLEVTPDVVLSLLRRCKEIPRRQDAVFAVETDSDRLSSGVLMEIAWEHRVETDDERVVSESEAEETDDECETAQELVHPEYVAPLPYGDAGGES